MNIYSHLPLLHKNYWKNKQKEDLIKWLPLSAGGEEG